MFQTLFLKVVTSAKHYRVIPAERRGHGGLSPAFESQGRTESRAQGHRP
jgi:hypothetical protein